MNNTTSHKRCSDQVAIVTGGARGIGRALALTLAAEGARVAVWDVNFELASYGVNVNGLAPGVIESDMTRDITRGDWSTYLAGIPMSRVGTIDEVAKVTVFLASDDASHLTGKIIDIKGGQFMH